MKAAILHELGQLPKYEDFAAPTPRNEHELLIRVRASAIKQLDKLKVSGKHYTTFSHLPIAVGTDGTGVLNDGTRVYAMGITGMLAEKALIPAHSWVKIPDNVDFATAAALPNSLIGSDVALIYRAKIQKGDVVLINGATGVTGKLAVQCAKHRGASKVIVTGRNSEMLKALELLGADEIISLKQPEEDIFKLIKEIQTNTPIDIVLDYLWGHPTELILKAVKQTTPRKMKIVVIGEMAGSDIALPSAILRSTQIELLGSGIGSVTMPELGHYMKTTLPEMFKLVADGMLRSEIETIPLEDIEHAWVKETAPGKRLVITI